MEMQGAAAAMGPLRGPGSKGSEGSEGSKGEGIALAGDEIYCRLSAAALPEAAKTIQPGYTRRKYTPIPAYGGTSPKGKHVTGFSGRFAPLRIQFLCHPGGRSFSGAMP